MFQNTPHSCFVREVYAGRVCVVGGLFDGSLCTVYLSSSITVRIRSGQFVFNEKRSVVELLMRVRMHVDNCLSVREMEITERVRCG